MFIEPTGGVSLCEDISIQIKKSKMMEEGAYSISNGPLDLTTPPPLKNYNKLSNKTTQKTLFPKHPRPNSNRIQYLQN